ncbi:iron uptake porin [Vacuolonema iberomarrocanum]|uniref:iron uptake porin n=1 Tax=Vacuolonema iberomarrocanum TaxID=3454632 RepID=UPI0019F94572|nr:carbohydrate porin [filamentous cyanobacterium LEGE 07170]
MLSKFLWKSLLVAPAVFGASLVSSAAIAQTAPEAGVEGNSEMATLDQIMEYSNEGSGAGSLAQVTSVTQFSDVNPGEWAYEALSFLANSEDLGGLDCLEGYPDGTYRGTRALTRYEFAAGLAACLDAIAGPVNAEQLERIEALQREFAAELAALRGRVDALEAAVDELEANQFSTTTRLNAEAIFAVADLFGGDDVELDIDDDGDTDGDYGSVNNLFLGYRLRMNFDTSFTGEDRLRTRFQARDMPAFYGSASPDPLPDGFVDEFDDLNFEGGGDGDVVLDDFYYQFPLGPVEFTLGLNSVGISDIVTDVSPFSSSGSGSVGFFGYNPIYDLGAQDQALGLTFDFNDSIELGLGYLTDESPDPAPGAALFNGDNTYFGQLTFDNGDLVVALTYVNAYVGEGGISGDEAPTVYNSYGLSANFVLGDRFQIGGWVNYTDGRTFDGTPLVGNGRYWSYAGTLGVSDLGLDGSLLGLIVGVPTYAAIYDFAEGGLGARGSDASLYVEGFYRIPISDNIAITPSVIFVDDPSNNNDNDGIVIGALRTTFRF